MAWKTQRTGTSVTVDADVGLSDFDEPQLLQGLINAKWLSEDEAEAIAKRAKAKEASQALTLNIDSAEFSIALDYLRAGNRHEALIHVERFLGREFMGRLT